MILSLIAIAVCFGASVWLYTVLHDQTSLIIMALMFAALVWYGVNVIGMLRKK